jgi:hypothetical protein
MLNKKYDDRHGGPYDRGSADSWYSRPREPHYYVGGTGTSAKVTALTAEEVAAYHAGYDKNEKSGGKKDWG